MHFCGKEVGYLLSWKNNYLNAEFGLNQFSGLSMKSIIRILEFIYILLNLTRNKKKTKFPSDCCAKNCDLELSSHLTSHM